MTQLLFQRFSQSIGASFVSIDRLAIVAVLIGRSTSFSSFQSRTFHKKSEIFSGMRFPQSLKFRIRLNSAFLYDLDPHVANGRNVVVDVRVAVKESVTITKDVCPSRQ